MVILKKEVKLDLSNIPKSSHVAVKNAVGDFIVNQVLRDIERGFSPVENEGQFKQLTKDYADKEKGGRRTSNLQLEGDLKEAMQYRRSADGIVYGNFIASEKNKSDGHNQHSSKAKAWAKKNNFPKRTYIPTEKQNFRSGIEREIDNIVASFEQVAFLSLFEEVSAEDIIISSNETETGNRVTTEITDVFSDDAIEAEIRRQLNNEV